MSTKSSKQLLSIAATNQRHTIETSSVASFRRGRPAEFVRPNFRIEKLPLHRPRTNWIMPVTPSISFYVI